MVIIAQIKLHLSSQIERFPSSTKTHQSSLCSFSLDGIVHQADKVESFRSSFPPTSGGGGLAAHIRSVILCHIVYRVTFIVTYV